MRKQVLSLFVVSTFLLQPLLLKGQENVYPDKAYLVSYFEDTRDIIVSPFNWQKKDWLTFGGITATGAFLYTQDEEIRDFFQRNRSDLGNDFTNYFAEPLGGGPYIAGVTGIMYLYGEFAGNQKAKMVSLEGAKAFVLTAGATYTFKLLFHRERPEGFVSDADNWNGPSFSFEDLSFPSAHTSLAFAVATVYAEEYSDVKWVPITAYSLATIAGLSRMYDDAHWASDVLFGAALGWGIGKLVANKNNWGIQIEPVQTSMYTGIGLTVPLD